MPKFGLFEMSCRTCPHSGFKLEPCKPQRGAVEVHFCCLRRSSRFKGQFFVVCGYKLFRAVRCGSKKMNRAGLYFASLERRKAKWLLDQVTSLYSGSTGTHTMHNKLYGIVELRLHTLWACASYRRVRHVPIEQMISNNSGTKRPAENLQVSGVPSQKGTVKHLTTQTIFLGGVYFTVVRNPHFLWQTVVGPASDYGRFKVWFLCL